MNAIDNLTVCITSFKRPKFLERALASVRAAGIRRVAVGAVCPTPETLAVLDSFKDGWLSWDVFRVDADLGCNRTWILAAYAAKTSRIIVLHDDDTLKPGFAQVYETIISPALDSGKAGFATWRAELLYEDGHTKPTEFWYGPTRIVDSEALLSVVAKRERLSLSPIISVFDRQTLIRACKESEQTLLDNKCLQHPGMLLGTEIVVYMRHIEKFPNWLYVDQVLSQYGSHAGSGTVDAERYGGIPALAAGYDLARDQGRQPAPDPLPRILLAHAPNPAAEAEEVARNKVAYASWQYHFLQGDVIEFAISPNQLGRTGLDIGDTRPIPFVRDLFDLACASALPEDIVAYINLDIGLTTLAPERLIEGVEYGRGVTVCARRIMRPDPTRLYKSVLNCKADGGFDVMAVTPAWWGAHRELMPDMLIGREAWDTCFRVLAEESADGCGPLSHVSISPDQWRTSRAYTDDVCWHQPHAPTWQAVRVTSGGQIHNRAKAAQFFEARANHKMVNILTKAPPAPASSRRRPKLVYRPTLSPIAKKPANHLCVVLTHSGAVDAVKRHLPIWSQTADRVMFFSPTDSAMGLPNLDERLIGRAEHHGELSAQRIIATFKAILAEPWTLLQLNEYDSLCFHLPSRALPKAGGMAACWRKQNNPKYTASGFPSFPMLFTRQGLERLVGAMETIPPSCPDRAWADRFIGLAADRSGIPVKNLKSDGLAWHQNTIDLHALAQATRMAQQGRCMFHGIKDSAVLHRIASAVRRY